MATGETFDFAIVGAGVSGLSLAWQLCESSLSARSILLVDGARDEAELRTLSFWSTQPIALEPLVKHAWHTLRLQLGASTHDLALHDFSYRTLFFADLQRATKERLGFRATNRVVEGRLDELVEEDDGVTLRVGAETFRADWVFDSRFVLRDLKVGPRFHSLRQHFHGWVVRAPRPVWRSDVATLFDFRVDAPAGTAFMYVLPRSPTEALVELVTLSPLDAEPLLRAYLERAFSLRDVELLAQEGGVSPMTEQPFAWRAGPRVRRIGIAAGRIKPSTGYALTRILEDGAGLVRALEKLGHPMVPPPSDGAFRALDAVMLNIWSVEPDKIPGIFLALFGRNPVDRVLRFLDQRASVVDVLRIAASLPVGPMLRGVWRWLLRRVFGRRGPGRHE